MAEASLPVDLRNPGQVFACLGLMEAAEVLCGSGAEGGFTWDAGATAARFTLSAPGDADPVRAVVGFLQSATVETLSLPRKDFSTAKWGPPMRERDDGDLAFPFEPPDSPAALPVRLVGPGGELPLEHWGDSARIGRDNVKFWAGAAGYSGAALARDALACVATLGGNALAEAAADPFAFEAPQGSSFRFDWRRDYIPLDAGFSPNNHTTVRMVGYPLVELLAAVGLQNARPERPDRRDKLAYRYGVWGVPLPAVLARAVLGAQPLGFPVRTFRIRLGWPGQEGQAHCIIDAQEEFSP